MVTKIEKRMDDLKLQMEAIETLLKEQDNDIEDNFQILERVVYTLTTTIFVSLIFVVYSTFIISQLKE
jgi:hypothetical protein